MPGFWDSLKTVMELSRRLQLLEEDNVRIRQEWRETRTALDREWSDTLDFLNAREARERKRNQRRVKGESEQQADPGVVDPNAPPDKAELRRRAAQLLGGRR